MVSFYLIYLNFGATSHLPKDKKLENDTGAYWTQANYTVSLIVAFLLGFGDCCFNTQIYAFLGWYYKKNSAPAFALFKSFQSIACAVSFFYAGVFLLYWQLVILAVFCVVAVFSYIILNKRVEAEVEEIESPEKSELPEGSM